MKWPFDTSSSFLKWFEHSRSWEHSVSEKYFQLRAHVCSELSTHHTPNGKAYFQIFSWLHFYFMSLKYPYLVKKIPIGTVEVPTRVYHSIISISVEMNLEIYPHRPGNVGEYGRHKSICSKRPISVQRQHDMWSKLEVFQRLDVISSITSLNIG